MPKTFRLAILRGRDTASQELISEEAFQATVTVGPTSVLGYWVDNTRDHLRFDTQVFPWVDVTYSAADIDFPNRSIARGVQASKIFDATSAAGGGAQLDGFDGYLVFALPGLPLSFPNPNAAEPGEPATVQVRFDGGSAGGLNGKPYCVLPVMNADHTFMCHELGHVIGLGHSYGVWNNGADWDGAANGWMQFQVYGDPYDIMSSGAFGTRVDPAQTTYFSTPAFAGASEAGWPVQPMMNMGPAPAASHLHLWDDAAVPAAAIRHLQLDGSTQTVRIHAASSNDSPRLVVVHPDNEDDQGRGRCYIDFRQAAGWDRGLDLAGNDLARQGVVAHTLADTPDEGVRSWYRGKVVVPLQTDSDLRIAGTPLTVRVTDYYPEHGTVGVEISQGDARGLDLDRMHEDTIVDWRDLTWMGTPCGDQIVHGTWVTESHYTFLAVTYGFGGEGAPDAADPVVSWTIAGVAVPGTGPLSIPTADGDRTIVCTISAGTGELTVDTRGGDRVFGHVVAEVAGEGVSLSATSTLDAAGSYTGYRPYDLNKLDSCMAKYTVSVDLEPYERLIPPGPDPYRERWKDELNAVRLERIIDVVENRSPARATALKQLAKLRYGATR